MVDIIGSIVVGVFLLTLVIAGIIWFFKCSDKITQREKESHELNKEKVKAIKEIAENTRQLKEKTENETTNNDTIYNK